MKKTGFWRLSPFRSPWCVVKTPTPSATAVSVGSSIFPSMKRGRGRPKKLFSKTFSPVQGPRTAPAQQYRHPLATIDQTLLSLSPFIPPSSTPYCPVYYLSSSPTLIPSTPPGSLSPTAPLSPIVPLSPTQSPELLPSRAPRPAALRLNPLPEADQPLAVKRNPEENKSPPNTTCNEREKLTDFKLDAPMQAASTDSYSEAVEGLCKLISRKYTKPQFSSCCSTIRSQIGYSARAQWNFVNRTVWLAPRNKLQLLCDVALGAK